MRERGSRAEHSRRSRVRERERASQRVEGRTAEKERGRERPREAVCETDTGAALDRLVQIVRREGEDGVDDMPCVRFRTRR